MEANQPDFLQEDFDIAGGIVINHLRDIVNTNALVALLAAFIIGLAQERDDGVNEFSEVLTNWQVNKDVLEQTNKVFACKATDTLKTRELAQWVEGLFCDTWILVILDT